PDRWTDVLVPGLEAVLRTPLGAPLGGLRLCDVPRGERFDELRFDLPLAGGTSHGRPPFPRTARASGIAAALRARDDGGLPDDWLASLDRLEEIELAGFLTGSIDLVFRAASPAEGRPRWYVVDYKSNRLDPARTRR